MIGLGSKAQEKFQGQRSVYCFGENGKFLHCIFERNCAVKTWEISEMDFEMNCCETRAGKYTGWSGGWWITKLGHFKKIEN